MATPNMTLVLPVEDGSSGTWDTLLNEAVERIDLHDHTSGLGVPIPTAGISLDADLPYGGYAATGVKAIDFNAVATIASGYLTSLFVDSGDGELYWRTAGGVNVQLTDGNTLNAASLGGITGDYGTGDEEVSYSSSSFIYNFLRDDSPLRRAFIDTADIRLFESTNGITNAVKLISPTALAASYTITFPTALPGSTSLMLMSAAGVISTSRDPTIDTLTTTGDLTVGGGLEVTGGCDFLASSEFAEDLLVSGSLSVAETIEMAGEVVLAGVSTPAAFGAAQHNYATAGLSRLRVSFSAGSLFFGGLADGVDGKLVHITNTSFANDFELADEHASSTAANRFKMPGGLAVTVPAFYGAVTVIYDGTLSRWLLHSTNF